MHELKLKNIFKFGNRSCNREVYPWSLNGQPLKGVTNVTYDFYLSNAGTYSIQVQNGFASVKTNLMTLSLGIPPVITMQPADQTLT